MSDTFDTDFDHEPVLEGFLCPICKADLKTPDALTAHVDAEHAATDDQALIRSFRGMLRRIRNDIASNIRDTAASATSGQQQQHSGKTSPGSSSGSSSSASLAAAAQTQAAGAVTVSTSAYPPIYADPAEPQRCGADMDHTALFSALRSPRLERYATDTNKLLIRLHKLLQLRGGGAASVAERAQRKQHEQATVPWCDGRLVPACPACARKFGLTRRQHHCRLCGTVMCADCSRFLDLREAEGLVNPAMAGGGAPLQSPTGAPATTGGGGAGERRPEDSTLRVCSHCLHLLCNRQDMQDSRTYRPPICELYDRIERIKLAARPDCQSYDKVVGSLLAGDTIFTLADAQALRQRIGVCAEQLDALSKRILQLNRPATGGGTQAQDNATPSAERLQRFVRLACVQYIKEQMLALEALPTAEEVARRQQQRREETERRIERERRAALELWERRAAAEAAEAARRERDAGGPALDGGRSGSAGRGNAAKASGGSGGVSGSTVASLDNWTATSVGGSPQMLSSAAAAAGSPSADDVLVEQINQIKAFIRQAREALRFEEVEILELNLRELQHEFYERQQLAHGD